MENEKKKSRRLDTRTVHVKYTWGLNRRAKRALPASLPYPKKHLEAA